MLGDKSENISTMKMTISGDNNIYHNKVHHFFFLFLLNASKDIRHTMSLKCIQVEQKTIKVTIK